MTQSHKATNIKETRSELRESISRQLDMIEQFRNEPEVIKALCDQLRKLISAYVGTLPPTYQGEK